MYYDPDRWDNYNSYRSWESGFENKKKKKIVHLSIIKNDYNTFIQEVGAVVDYDDKFLLKFFRSSVARDRCKFVKFLCRNFHIYLTESLNIPVSIHMYRILHEHFGDLHGAKKKIQFYF